MASFENREKCEICYKNPYRYIVASIVGNIMYIVSKDDVLYSSISKKYDPYTTKVRESNRICDLCCYSIPSYS